MKRWLSFLFAVVVLNALMMTLTARETFVAHATSDSMIYDDALENSFQDWSWAEHSLANASPVYIGTHSISVTMHAWEGIRFVNAGAGPDSSAYSALQFAIHGGSVGGQPLTIRAGSTLTYSENAVVDLNTYLPGGPVANAWRVVTIPLGALNLRNKSFKNLAFQESSGQAQPTFYLDDIRLVAAPFTETVATIRINPTVSQPFDSRLLGSNLPNWVEGNGIFYDPVFLTRTLAAGIKYLRIPGGSDSDEYDWTGCEGGSITCTWAARPTDFINFLRASKTQAIYTVNANDTPQKAAALVAFFNSDITDTTVIGDDVRGSHWYTAGVWAQLRAKHGNVAPFKITYWELGNEVYGGDPNFGGAECQPWGWEPVWTCDGAAYANSDNVGASHNFGYIQFRDAMRLLDPNIQVGAVGTMSASDYSNWGTKVLTSVGQTMDFYIIHAYAYDTPPASYDLALTQPVVAWKQTRADLNSTFNTYAGGRSIPIAVTEYNLFSGFSGDTGAWMTRTVNALFLADTLGQMAQNGMRMANQWDLTNGVVGGTDYSLINRDTLARYPSYYAFPLWARFGSQMLAVSSTLRVTDTLSVYAGRIGPTTISLLAINKTNQPITATIQISGAGAIVSGTADAVKANALGDASVTFNGLSNPSDDLSNAPPEPLANPTNPLTYTFAPYSITLLRMNVALPVYLPLIQK